MREYRKHNPAQMSSSAQTCHRKNTGSPVKWFDKAVKLQADGLAEQAQACYRKAIELSPEMVEAYYNSGTIYFGQKAWKDAIVQFKKALDLKPDFEDAAFNLATSLKENGNYNKAIRIYQITLQYAPNMPEAHFQHGICHLLTASPHRAEQAIGQSVALAPQNARYRFHLAEAYMLQENVDAAVDCYRKVIELQPEWDAAHYNLAVALRIAERIEAAIHHAKQVTRINPDHVKVVPLLFRLAQHACDWQLADSAAKRIDIITEKELKLGLKTTEPPLTSIRRCQDVQANMKIARSWCRHLAGQNQPAASSPAQRTSVSANGRLRVGYLSSDFKDHAVAYQIRGMFEKHDRNRFEIFGYACNPNDGSPYRRRLAEVCDRFLDVHAHSDIAITCQIKNDGIDILVDMAGHSRGNRLGVSALRPAPVQVSYLGFLGTTGADFIDYVLADPIVIPEDHAAYYTEKIAYLPYCYQANDDLMPIAEQIQYRQQWQLPEEAFVFCNFNQPYKIDADLFRSWMTILSRVPLSVLWLVERSGPARKNLCRAAENAKVDPARLIFTEFVPMDQNLARLRLSDLVLDTLIYNGGATTANALWAGVPVLTTIGGHWVSRMSASALNAIGLPELVAANRTAYENEAVELALNPTRLSEIRDHLQRHRSSSPLFNTSKFTRYVERAFNHMWKLHAAGLPPTSFRVEP